MRERGGKEAMTPHRVPTGKSLYPPKGSLVLELIRKIMTTRILLWWDQFNHYKTCPKCGRHGKAFIARTADEDYYCRYCMTIFNGKGEIIE
jgi:hypothetical protein